MARCVGASVYAYSTFDGIFSIVFALLESAPSDTVYKSVGRILFALGVVSFLFNEKSRGYYRLQTKTAVAAAIVIGGTAILAFAVQLGLHLMVEAVPAESSRRSLRQRLPYRLPHRRAVLKALPKIGASGRAGRGGSSAFA